VHPSEAATLQCLGCVKGKLAVAKSYHCSPKCFADAWRHHQVMHARAASFPQENGAEEDEPHLGHFNSGSVGGIEGALIGGNVLSNGSVFSSPARTSGSMDQVANGDTWYEVGRGKTYTPTADDVGHVLKLECMAVDSSTGLGIAAASTVLTSRVIPAPSPTPRRLIPVNSFDGPPGLEMEGRIAAPGTFTVLSYNVLADLYATSDMYSYCPPWALSWAYRRQNLLREIVQYRADILCLQEVQSDHFEEFFSPELEKHGYAAVYKKKTAEVTPLLLNRKFSELVRRTSICLVNS
jgi:CCR4-NOT transcription complex subunit 6